MDAADFLRSVVVLLPTSLGDGVTLLDVRVDRQRSWPRAAARFEVRGRVGSGSAGWSACGVAFAPIDEEWRYLSAYERPQEYAGLLTDTVRSAARALRYPAPSPKPAAGPDEVAERWQWLLERLSESGRPVEQDDGTVHVVEDDGSEFTVLVTPEEWARIAEPLDPLSDDPQDFNHLEDQEAFLVFHEDALEWSIRAELPPVRFGGEIRRSFREARERGEDMSRYGWFAYSPLGTVVDQYDRGPE